MKAEAFWPLFCKWRVAALPRWQVIDLPHGSSEGIPGLLTACVGKRLVTGLTRAVVTWLFAVPPLHRRRFPQALRYMFPYSTTTRTRFYPQPARARSYARFDTIALHLEFTGNKLICLWYNSAALTLPMAEVRGFLLRRDAPHRGSYRHSRGVAFPLVRWYVPTRLRFRRLVIAS